MLKLEATSKHKLLKATILESENSISVRDRLTSIPNKKPVYHKGELQHWEFPGNQINDFLEKFKEEELLLNDHADNLINSWRLSNMILENLPQYQGKLFQSLDGKVPRDHQENFIRIDFKKKAILLALQQGLGKSLSSLLRLATINPEFKTLIVVPRGLRDKWQTDIYNILGKESTIYYGNKKQRAKILPTLLDQQFVIATYETLKEIEPLKLNFEFIIIDEIHIPGGGSAIYRTLDKVLRFNDDAHILGLSGTPMRLTLENLYDVCKLIDPVWAGRKSAFLAKFQKTEVRKKITKRNRFGQLYSFYVPIKVSSQNPEVLREKLGSIMFRKTREGIIDFEDAIDVIPVPMTGKQTELYYQVLEEVREEVKNGGSPFNLILRPLQMAEGAYTLFPECLDSGKQDFLLSELKDKEGEKACIWFRYLPGTDLLHDKLKDCSVLVTGDTNDNLRKYAKWAFNGVTNSREEEEFHRIKEKYNLKFGLKEATYYISTYSLRSGMGLDLDAATTNYFMSYDYSPASISQSRDRIVRLSQTEDCITKFIVSSKTIEPKALSNILKKMENTQSVVDGNWSTGASNTREIINLLFEGIK